MVLPIRDQDYFHGALPEDEAVQLVRKDGDYLVRESKDPGGNDVYALTVRWGTHQHFIVQDKEGMLHFEGKEHPTITELISELHGSGKLVSTKTGTLLQNPILREDWGIMHDDIILEKLIAKVLVI